QLTQRTSAQSDDRGNYRLYDLPPGRYYVQAGGRSLMALATAAGQGSMGSPSPYATVIYPNATKIGDAQAVPVPAGGEVSGISLMMRSGATYNVNGKIMDLRNAKPVGGAVLIVTTEDFLSGMTTQGQTRPDGVFR